MLQSCKNGKEMYKKAWCMCKVAVLLIKPIAFFMFSSLLPSTDLKVPKHFLEAVIGLGG